MSVPFVRVDRVEGKPSVVVEINDANSVFPLTADGCRKAGQRLFEAGWFQWLYSSSADFPEEVKHGCKLDVRALVEGGHEAARLEMEGPQRSMLVKVYLRCMAVEFQKSLTPAESAAFQELFQNVAKRARKQRKAKR